MSESAMTIDEFGNKNWKNSTGQYHRTNGPAIEYVRGNKSWYQNGKLHRLNGPAFEYADGFKAWWVNGKCLGFNDEGFWKLWDKLTPEQKQSSNLLEYLPENFSV